MERQGNRKSENQLIKVRIFTIKGREYVYCEIDGERQYRGPLEQELEIAKKLLAKAGPKEVVGKEILNERVLSYARRGLEVLDKLIRGARFDIAEYGEHTRHLGSRLRNCLRGYVLRYQRLCGANNMVHVRTL